MCLVLPQSQVQERSMIKTARIVRCLTSIVATSVKTWCALTVSCSTPSNAACVFNLQSLLSSALSAANLSVENASRQHQHVLTAHWVQSHRLTILTSRIRSWETSWICWLGTNTNALTKETWKSSLKPRCSDTRTLLNVLRKFTSVSASNRTTRRGTTTQKYLGIWRLSALMWWLIASSATPTATAQRKDWSLETWTMTS